MTSSKPQPVVQERPAQTAAPVVEEKPAVEGQAAAQKKPQAEHDYLDIPAFLRKQAD